LAGVIKSGSKRGSKPSIHDSNPFLPQAMSKQNGESHTTTSPTKAEASTSSPESSETVIQTSSFLGSTPIVLTLKSSIAPESKSIIGFKLGKKEKEKWITFEIKNTKNPVNPEEIKKNISSKRSYNKKRCLLG